MPGRISTWMQVAALLICCMTSGCDVTLGPKTKTEYVALLASLEQQIKDIAAANTAAQEEYAAARAVVDKDFEARIVVAKEGEGNQWSAIRLLRDQNLRDSDWTVLPDSPMSKSETWKSYRQALRDIPQTYKSPSEVVWPEAPQ